MDPSLDPALKVAEFLLQIKAVKLSPRKPFTWASGWKSPIYCDNRKTLSYPPIRTYIRQQFVHVINSEFGRPDIIAGVATGGIAHGALVAHDMGLPFIYFLLPLLTGLKPLLGIALSLTLILTGFACAYVAMAIPKTNASRGTALLVGAALALFEPWIGLAIGVSACLLLVGLEREQAPAAEPATVEPPAAAERATP